MVVLPAPLGPMRPAISVRPMVRLKMCIRDRIQVEVSPEVKYWVEIRAIEKGRDDESLEISSY